MIRGRRETIRVARSIDSLKLTTVWVSDPLASSLEIARSLVMFRDAVLLLRSVAVQARVPLKSTVNGIVAIIGHTIILLEAGTPIAPQY